MSRRTTVNRRILAGHSDQIQIPCPSESDLSSSRQHWTERTGINLSQRGLPALGLGPMLRFSLKTTKVIGEFGEVFRNAVCVDVIAGNSERLLASRRGLAHDAIEQQRSRGHHLAMGSGLARRTKMDHQL